MKAIRLAPDSKLPDKPKFHILRKEGDVEVIVGEVFSITTLVPETKPVRHTIHWERPPDPLHFTSLLEALDGNHHRGLNTPHDVMTALAEFSLTAPLILQYDTPGTELLLLRICRQAMKDIFTSSTVSLSFKEGLEASFSCLGDTFAMVSPQVLEVITTTRIPRRRLK